jgi:hypothetical protein
MSENTVTGFGKLLVTEHQDSVNNPASFFFFINHITDTMVGVYQLSADDISTRHNIIR